MSDTRSPAPPPGSTPPGYPTQAPQPQYIEAPVYTQKKSGSSGWKGAFIKGFQKGVCCCLQFHSQAACPCCPGLPCCCQDCECCWQCCQFCWGCCPCKGCCSPCCS